VPGAYKAAISGFRIKMKRNTKKYFKAKDFYLFYIGEKRDVDLLFQPLCNLYAETGILFFYKFD